ncbi:MAG: hypothetical protein H6607_05580 [Flavobacteriales bacterium]|nr:hypothetical protein [Flavobacteriales bacterium]
MRQLLFAIFGFAVVLFSGCDDENSVNKDTIQSAEDNSLVETHFTAIFDAAFDIISTIDSSLKKSDASIIPGDVSILFVDSTFMDGDGLEIVVDFGPLRNTEPQGVLCVDGRYRAGKFTIAMNLPLGSPQFQAEIIINQEDSYFSGNGQEMAQLSGRTIVTLPKENELRIVVENALLKDNLGDISWSSDRRVTQIVDKGKGIWGDSYSITGSASGINRMSQPFTAEITSPLVKKMDLGCAKTFIEGILEITSDNSQNIQIDYDPYKNADCDQLAEATINGHKTIFEVR